MGIKDGKQQVEKMVAVDETGPRIGGRVQDTMAKLGKSSSSTSLIAVAYMVVSKATSIVARTAELADRMRDELNRRPGSSTEELETEVMIVRFGESNQFNGRQDQA